jgi:serine/threonine-protein kinase RsbW
MSVAVRLSWRLLPHARAIAAVRMGVDASLEAIGVAEDLRMTICVLVSEACTNVVQHARTSEPYDLTVEADSARCVVTVADSGVGLPPVALPLTAPDPTRLRGRGLYLMQTLADEMKLQTPSSRGTVIQLIKALA